MAKRYMKNNAQHRQSSKKHKSKPVNPLRMASTRQTKEPKLAKM
jgi:hypothetical protein